MTRNLSCYLASTQTPAQRCHSRTRESGKLLSTIPVGPTPAFRDLTETHQASLLNSKQIRKKTQEKNGIVLTKSEKGALEYRAIA